MNEKETLAKERKGRGPLFLLPCAVAAASKMILMDSCAK